MDSDGNAYAWGCNDTTSWIDVVNSTPVRSYTPTGTDVPETFRYTQIRESGRTTTALGSNGNVYAWGNGPLGNNTHGSSRVPVRVWSPAGTPIGFTYTQISRSAAIGSDGRAYAWGGNYYGQLGNVLNSWNGSPNNKDSYVPIPAKPRIVITGVTFAGKPASMPKANGDGTYTVTTPANSIGPADVAITYTSNTIAQPVFAMPGAFTYHPTTTSLPLTGSAAGALITCAGSAFTLLLTACALAAYRHHHYGK